MISHLPTHLDNYPPLRTERMLLVPLSLDQMQMQLDDYAGLESSLGTKVTGNALERELRSIVARSIAYMRQEPEDAIWNTFWAAILEDEKTFVGGIGFKGPTNAEGEVELGYGFDPSYRNRGLATEAVTALAAWAFAQPGVRAVTAETNYTNTASARVLQKAGFRLYTANNHFLYWRKEAWENRPLPGQERTGDGYFALYDLAVVVEAIDGNCTCDMRVGDCFFLRNSSSLSLPDGGHFCVYALQAVLPLLPAKQRLNHPADWMETDSRAVCPDPACKLVMRVDRTARRVLRHDDVSPIAWEST
ncbi:MAG: GNAT family N-acetyltransferase [Chloroflexi bacterium]|nr:GNAT family N-acetyltransferase [Chloroflexota bacterium]